MSKLLSKFTLKSSGHNKERSATTSPSPSRTRRSSYNPSADPSINDLSSSQPLPPPAIVVNKAPSTRSLDTETSSLNPNVTIVPPSPLVVARGLPQEGSQHDDQPASFTQEQPSLSGHRRTSSSPAAPVTPVTARPFTPPPPPLPALPAMTSPATTSPKMPSRPTTPISSPTQAKAAPQSPSNSPPTLEAPQSMKHSSSSKSLRSLFQISTSALHSRATTSPDTRQQQDAKSDEEDQELEVPTGSILSSMSPIVESPTGINSPDLLFDSPPKPITRAASIAHGDTIAAIKSAQTFAGLPTTPPSAEKRKNTAARWKKPTSKPTGLAGAIAASGLAMANPVSQMTPPPAVATAARQNTIQNIPGLPGGSKEVSPRRKAHARKTSSPRRRLSVSHSAYSDIGTEYTDDANNVPEFYSSLEDDSSSDDSDSEASGIDDLNLDEDMPVTGYAVAGARRNIDFHEMFPQVPEGDYLIDDYGCALQREILIQGRLYVSENHICFHANIFGWQTDVVIPVAEIESVEKKMTAFVIPNAILVTTVDAKYHFASLLSRDNTFDVVHNVWRIARPGDGASMVSSGRASQDHRADGLAGLGTGHGNGAAGDMKKITQCACGKDGSHYNETPMDIVVPGTPDKIYTLMFQSGFMKDFMAVNQKLMDIQISDWTPVDGKKLLARNMSYIKPLNGSVGPKQTKCEIRDETLHCDFEDYVCTMTTTRTPDVPSGGVFAVKTRTCIMWASKISTRIVVTTVVEWSGRSFIKGIIERSAIEGQKQYHNDLDKAMRAYISEHKSEFIPAGMDAETMAAAAAAEKAEEAKNAPAADSQAEADRKRERERNQRAFQWAWDTWNGASNVASTATRGALDLVGDAWEQSSSQTILYFVIIGLIISNLYTWTRAGKQVESGWRPETRRREDKDEWIHGVVAALRQELGHTHGGLGGSPPPRVSIPSDPSTDPTALEERANSLRTDLRSLTEELNQLEGRIRAAKWDLTSMGKVDSLV